MLIRKSIKFGKYELTLETGVIARQATASVVVNLAGTVVLVTLVVSPEVIEGQDFFPLRVDYQERAYAHGKIPGGFIKREGRPSEREILISRLIDRSLRPLFPEGFYNEIQIIATVQSLNPQVDPDVLALIGASAALAISGVPFNEIMGAARVGHQDSCYVLNPDIADIKNSNLDLMVAGTRSSILMVESSAKELPENVMLGAVMFGHKQMQEIIQFIEDFAKQAKKPDWDWKSNPENVILKQEIKKFIYDKLIDVYSIKDKLLRQKQLKNLRKQATDHFVTTSALEINPNIKIEVVKILEDLERELVRGNVLNKALRIDGRDLKTIRPITIQTGILPRTHGSALFTRGETQAIVVVTLGTSKDAQTIDGLMGEQKDSFMLHYNFPPFCVGEIGQVGSPKRREIGHGKLAMRGIQAVMPSIENFSYVVRVVSEITESNGSSSMATVCGTSLALMDAGVPIKSAVAGIAMGLIKEGNQFAVISDILGDEDHLGDMDFKVAGTQKGITALQMDIKINGITEEIMSVALEQAREGRMHILGIMDNIITASRQDVSKYAPRIIKMSINPERIKDVIGKGGATIRSLIEDPNSTSIDIQENGTVHIAVLDYETGKKIKERIESLTSEVTVGKIYNGKVVKIVEFGAFVNILPNQDGLVHISQISTQRVNNVADILKEGQEVKVKVLDIDKQGRLKLSIKACLEPNNDNEHEGIST